LVPRREAGAQVQTRAYIELFKKVPSASQDISIEKSPSYFVTDIAPERVHAMNKSILLLLIVRDPVLAHFFRH
jgi:hypothetical protein